MRPQILAAMLLLSAGAAIAQQAPMPPAGSPAPGEPMATQPAPPPMGETPGMAPGAAPATMPATDPAMTPAQPMGSTPGSSAGAMGSSAMGDQAAGQRQAMTEYPVCTRQMRDNCRQPTGRKVPPPA